MPFLLEQEDCLLKDVFNSVIVEDRFWGKIAEHESLIKQNYQVMDLSTISLSPQNSKVIKESVEDYPLDFVRTEFIKMMMKDGFAELNWGDLYTSMNRIRIANAK